MAADGEGWKPEQEEDEEEDIDETVKPTIVSKDFH